MARRWLAIAAACLAAAAGAASAQVPGQGESRGMFPAKPDPFTPKLIEQEDAPLARLKPVTDAVLADPPASDWLMWRRTYDGWGYSPLDQINKSNVKGLTLAWAWALPNGATETEPLAHDGVVFIQSWGDGVEALNAANGDLLWRFTRPEAKGTQLYFKRFMALGGDKLYLATSDRHLIALDTRTGKPEWDHEVTGDGSFSFTSGPMVLNGKVIIGASNCVTMRCFIAALDGNDGHELWRFYTVANAAEPGGDTWNGIPDDERYGGSAWTSGSYDPQTKLLYWGVGQPYPWDAFARGTSPLKPGQNNDALYTDNTLALDPDTGKLVWHYSHLGNDSWDLDYVFERELIDVPVKGKPRKLVVTAGKLAIIEALDAKTGKFVLAKDLGIQTVVSKIDPVTGAKTINPAVIPEIGKPVVFCPHSGGARSTPASAYDPQTRLLYMPWVEHCTQMIAADKLPGSKTANASFTIQLKDGSDGNLGHLDAVNLETGQVAWSHRERTPQSTGALPTAGGIVFEGSVDRYFSAYDAVTGALLWRTRLNDVPNGPPITYSVGGREYVAVTTGSGSPFVRTDGNLLKDVRIPPSGGATLWVFALPDQR
jgi:alcohol dehydrogenase (cytochrome c)